MFTKKKLLFLHYTRCRDFFQMFRNFFMLLKENSSFIRVSSESTFKYIFFFYTIFFFLKERKN